MRERSIVSAANRDRIWRKFRCRHLSDAPNKARILHCGRASIQLLIKGKFIPGMLCTRGPYSGRILPGMDELSLFTHP